jgi:hypothetical protein
LDRVFENLAARFNWPTGSAYPKVNVASPERHQAIVADRTIESIRERVGLDALLYEVAVKRSRVE